MGFRPQRVGRGADRIDARNATLIRESIPDRIAYLDSLGLDLRPLAP